MSGREASIECAPGPEEQQPARISRRRFLKGSGAAAAATGLAGVGLVAERNISASGSGHPEAHHHAHFAPSDTATTRPVSANIALTFFNRHEYETVDALTARIIPGTPDDPGAREARVVDYIDSALAGPYGWGLQTYRQGPYLVVNESPLAPPPELITRRDVYQVIEVSPEEAPRYGYQSVLTPQEVYRRGLAAVDAYSQERFGADFIELTEEQQDQVVAALADGTATGFDDPSPQAFFTTLRTHTIEGMFSDPMYGGNRDMVGWKMIGYPGAQRAYSPDELRDPNWPGREPQSLTDLAGLHEQHEQ
ncbi:MAG TPA: gluconate 2-dehydrogenase subunit 3 family protein [Thermomicrobiales bacterium]